MDLPSRLDYYAIGRAYILQRATKIDPAQIDTQGSEANIFTGVASVLADHITKQLGGGISKLLLDGCETDDDIARYAWDRYRIQPKGASPARTTIRLVRPTFALGGGSIPTGTQILSDKNVEYVTVQPANYSPTSLSVVVDVRASQAGKATQVGERQLKRFAKPGSIFDSTITIEQPEPAAGGEDAETIDVFRERVRDYWNSARRGTLGAIETGALTVPGVVTASAVEAVTGGALPARVVELYIADSSGVASAALARQVIPVLNEWRAGGIAVLMQTSIPLYVNIKLRLSFGANVDTLTLTQVIQQAVVSFVNSLPVNGTLHVGDLYSVLRRYVTDGLVMNQDSIVAPVGDLIPDIGRTIRTTIDLVEVE